MLQQHVESAKRVVDELFENLDGLPSRSSSRKFKFKFREEFLERDYVYFESSDRQIAELKSEALRHVPRGLRVSVRPLLYDRLVPAQAKCLANLKADVAASLSILEAKPTNRGILLALMQLEAGMACMNTIKPQIHDASPSISRVCASSRKSPGPGAFSVKAGLDVWRTGAELIWRARIAGMSSQMRVAFETLALAWVMGSKRPGRNQILLARIGLELLWGCLQVELGE